jgi:hypothetical protein
MLEPSNIVTLQTMAAYCAYGRMHQCSLGHLLIWCDIVSYCFPR